jgi:hypothetical protein
VNIVNQIMKSVEIGEPLPLVQGRGATFPLVGRQDVAAAIYKHVCERLEHIAIRDKSHTKVACTAGCPGLGKSRINADTRAVLLEQNENDKSETGCLLAKRLQNSCFILMTYNSGITPIRGEAPFSTMKEGRKVEYVAASDIVHMFWCRVLYFYLHPKIDQLSLQQFTTEFSGGMLTGENVIKAIIQHSSTAIHYIHIGVDEYNNLMSAFPTMLLGREAIKAIIVDIKSTMAAGIKNGDTTVLLTTFFTGTVRENISKMFAGSFGDHDRICLTLLPMESICQLLDYLCSNKQIDIAPEVLFSRKILQAFSIVGTLPRATEIMVDKVLTKTVSLLPLHQIVAEVKIHLTERYKLAGMIATFGSVPDTYSILYHNILRIPVSSAFSLGDTPIQEHESTGYLMLIPRGSDFLIELPYV